MATKVPTTINVTPGTETVTSVGLGVPVSVPEAAYGVSWNGSTEVPTKNAVYDKIEALTAGVTEPPGVIKMYAGTTAPAGYLLCDGSLVSRTTYAALFAVCDIRYGVGDGFTTFNLPDLRLKFPLGKGPDGFVPGGTLGETGGTLDHTHTVPAHYHGMGSGADLNITSSGTHNHSVPGRTGPGFIPGPDYFNNANTQAAFNTNDENHTHPSGSFAGRIGLVTGGVDGNAVMTSGSSNPPYLVVNYIIKT